MEKILDVNRDIVVVLSNGGVVTLAGIAGKVPAILEMWLGGQASGAAAADMLLGQAEPAGRLAETIPIALAHTPAHLNWPGSEGKVLYGERIYVGYRWYDATEREVAFPFGHGLGHTAHALSDLQVRVPDPRQARALCSVRIQNTGHRAGSEMVQLYVSQTSPSADRPRRELRAFAKVHLAPGEDRLIEWELDERAFAYWGGSQWAVDPGEYAIEVGTSSRNLPVRSKITLHVPRPQRALSHESTGGEWLDHRTGRRVLEGSFAVGAGGWLDLEDEETSRLAGSIPLATMLHFADPGIADPREAVSGLLHQVAALEASDEAAARSIDTSK